MGEKPQGFNLEKTKIKTMGKLRYWFFTYYVAYAYGRKPNRLRGEIIGTY